MVVTTVVNVRGKARTTLLADPDFVYVGRTRAGWPASMWGNPYRVGKQGGQRNSPFQARSNYWLPTAEQAVERFERLLIHALDHVVPLHQPEAEMIVLTPIERMALHLAELRGKVLGCWCCDWDGTGEPARPCHAVVLARLADGGGIP